MNETTSSHRLNEEAGMGQPMPAPGAMGHKFSPDELRVLGECNSESFFQRSLPLGTLLGLTAFGAVQQGKLRPNPRFGALPKVSLAVVVGYFVGKLSYQSACAEKLMKLPGSYIGQMLRERRDEARRGGGGGGARAVGSRTPALFGATPGDIYSDAGPESSLDLDTDRPMFADDAHRPDLDLYRGAPEGSGAGGAGGAGGAPPPQGASYEELRARNRGQFTDARRDPYKVDPSEAPVVRRPPPPRPAPTNQYGDTVD